MLVDDVPRACGSRGAPPVIAHFKQICPSWGSLESMDQDHWGQESMDSPIFEHLLDLWLDLYPESMPTIELITQ